jgi:hypothetical protein
VTGDGRLDRSDAAHILARAVGRIDRFDGAAVCGSEWLFVPDPAPFANLDVMAPFVAPGTCRAGGLAYQPLQCDATGQDFRAALLGDCTGNWLPSEDERSLSPPQAPRGTEIVIGPLRRVRGQRWRAVIGVRGAALRALELELRFDAAALTPHAVHATRQGNPTLVDHHAAEPGRLRIALASAVALPADGRALLVVDFSARGAAAPAALSAAQTWIDERVVAAAAR